MFPIQEWAGIREEIDNSFDRLAALVKKYVDIPELTPTIVNEFIKKIIVYAPEKSGTKLRSWSLPPGPYRWCVLPVNRFRPHSRLYRL